MMTENEKKTTNDYVTVVVCYLLFKRGSILDSKMAGLSNCQSQPSSARHCSRLVMTNGLHVLSENMSIEEDSVEYWIFPELSHGGDDAERLEELRTKCFTFLSAKSRSYIWHEDGINLIQRNESGKIIANLDVILRFSKNRNHQVMLTGLVI